ncbi:MAG TPA: hypothetical protein VIK97_14870, partial [Casimicrobiaceae bacterium]
MQDGGEQRQTQAKATFRIHRRILATTRSTTALDSLRLSTLPARESGVVADQARADAETWRRFPRRELPPGR